MFLLLTISEDLSCGKKPANSSHPERMNYEQCHRANALQNKFHLTVECHKQLEEGKASCAV